MAAISTVSDRIRSSFGTGDCRDVVLARVVAWSRRDRVFHPELVVIRRDRALGDRLEMARKQSKFGMERLNGLGKRSDRLRLRRGDAASKSVEQVGKVRRFVSHGGNPQIDRGQTRLRHNG